jgi:hypothetical protein
VVAAAHRSLGCSFSPRCIDSTGDSPLEECSLETPLCHPPASLRFEDEAFRLSFPIPEHPFYGRKVFRSCRVHARFRYRVVSPDVVYESWFSAIRTSAQFITAESLAG